jgi:hypothetical protein
MALDLTQHKRPIRHSANARSDKAQTLAGFRVARSVPWRQRPHPCPPTARCHVDKVSATQNLAQAAAANLTDLLYWCTWHTCLARLKSESALTLSLRTLSISQAHAMGEQGGQDQATDSDFCDIHEEEENVEARQQRLGQVDVIRRRAPRVVAPIFANAGAPVSGLSR